MSKIYLTLRAPEGTPGTDVGPVGLDAGSFRTYVKVAVTSDDDVLLMVLPQYGYIQYAREHALPEDLRAEARRLAAGVRKGTHSIGDGGYAYPKDQSDLVARLNGVVARHA